MRSLATLLLFAALSARADLPAEAAEVQTPPSLPHIGLQLDAGAPHGAGVSLVYRPWRAIRLSLGGAYNLASYGIRGGVSLVPISFAIAPTLNFEVGHFFPGNAQSAIQRFTTVSPEIAPLLQRVGYHWVSAQLGLEFGAPRRFVFFVRGGISRLWAHSEGTGTVTSDGVRYEVVNPRLNLGIPTASAGFILYVY